MLNNITRRMNTLIIILAIILALGFICLGFIIFKVRRQAGHENSNTSPNTLSEFPVNTVHAGSDNGCSPVSREIIISTPTAIQFKDSKGKVLNPSDYDLYRVAGECMQYVNIHPNDLLFATKGFDMEKYNGKLPIVLILKRSVTASGVQPFYKLRRAWKSCSYRDNLGDILNSIIQSTEFQEVRRRSTYDGDKALIDDFFNTRVKKYEDDYINCEFPNTNDEKIIISTTFHPDIQSVRFSIHPISNVVGKVVAAFPIDGSLITCREKAIQ